MILSQACIEYTMKRSGLVSEIPLILPSCYTYDHLVAHRSDYLGQCGPPGSHAILLILSRVWTVSLPVTIPALFLTQLLQDLALRLGLVEISQESRYAESTHV